MTTARALLVDPKVPLPKPVAGLLCCPNVPPPPEPKMLVPVAAGC